MTISICEYVIDLDLTVQSGCRADDSQVTNISSGITPSKHDFAL